MTELIITEIGDTWIDGRAGRTGNNYGDTNFVQLLAGEREALLLPELGNISGRTVLDAFLVGHSRGTDAQTLSVVRVGEKWQPGRAKWSAPKPDVGPTVSAAVSAAADGEAVTVPGLAALVQAVADGSDWYGLRVTTNATTRQQFYATDSGQPAWELHVVLSDLTEPPTNLRPDGGAVDGARPILAWDAEGQVARRVQVDTPAAGVDPDEVTPDFDTGMQTSTDPQFDLATSSHTPAGTGPHFWRVQVIAEGDDAEPEWSDWAEFTVTALPSLIIDSPTGPFGDPSPTLAAHLSSGTLDYWKVAVTGPDRADVRARSGLQTGPLEWAVPEKADDRRVVVDGGWFYFEAHDDVDRAVAVGESGFVSAWVPIEYADSLGVQAPGDLSVAPLAPGDPRQRWTWTRTEAADAWVLQIDGQNFEIIDAADITASGGVYEWVDSGQVSPLRPHSLGVRALEGDQVSVAATVTQTHTVSGVWLIPDDTDPIRLNGTAVGGFANTSRRATYEPLVGPTIDVIYDANPGRVGAFSGSVDSRQDVWAALDAIEALRSSRTKRAQLVWGSQSIRVRVTDPDATSAETILKRNLEHDVRFGFVQVPD